MMGAAKATYYQAWEAKMNELKLVDHQAWDWLMKVPTRSWCKHAFNLFSKCDVLMNNLSESFNATILVARDKPILTLCEWIRNYLMNRIATSTSKLAKWQHKIMPMPMKRLEKEVFMASKWAPTCSNGEQWQVTHAYNQQQFIVDVSKRTCFCNFWELVGIPCRHAVAAIGYRLKDPLDFVDDCYSRDKYALCYGFAVSPINGMDMWPTPKPPEDVYEILLPPVYKIGPGRPKKLRISGVDEDGARKRSRGFDYRCTRCSEFGHNTRACKSKTQTQEGLNRKRKSPKGKAKCNASTSEVGGNASTSEAEVVVGTVSGASQSLFEEISDEVMATIPEVTVEDIAEANKDNADHDKDNVVKGKAVKQKSMKRKLYHGKRKRSSERIMQQTLAKPIVGVGSSIAQPIVIKEPHEGILTQEDSTKLETCYKAMKSWKNINKN
ncbi:uncharacterized protein LOC123905209 [Trifolium pratense]|uniref:uncharacterized protein LOC123905209 n=1 Tax=Trifolium pratense TaxID=57577 RepID=UPI001E69626B|nr:uncharacterized protein LOC123905209 [Trifolium pratense]